ncbi:MAG: sucrase ferredoxin [Candidatus Nanopelagicales bacterium]
MTRCSPLAAREVMAGTAPRARWWWLIDVPGPWGRDPLATCRVEAVRDLASTPERRVLLVRRTGRHPAADPSGPVRIWVAGALPGDPQPRVAVVADPRELLAWDPAHPPEGLLAADPEAPRLVICTNARRDLCCGLDGRALAQAVDSPLVWECSHLGGHRFAPTALDVRQGVAYGRLTAEVARRLVSDDGHGGMADASLSRWSVPWMRGRTSLPPAAQAAEIHLLGQGCAPDPGSLMLTDEPDGSVTVRFAGCDPVRMTQVPGGTRPASCGAEPEPWSDWIAA